MTGWKGHVTAFTFSAQTLEAAAVSFATGNLRRESRTSCGGVDEGMLRCLSSEASWPVWRSEEA
jgi:hypothetical protein